MKNETTFLVAVIENWTSSVIDNSLKYCISHSLEMPINEKGAGKGDIFYCLPREALERLQDEEALL